MRIASITVRFERSGEHDKSPAEKTIAYTNGEWVLREDGQPAGRVWNRDVKLMTQLDSVIKEYGQ